MRILVSDRDRLASQMIISRLTDAGHEVIDEAAKNAALEKVQGTPLDVVFFDPAPLANARPFILGLRRSLTSYPYIVMLSHNAASDELNKAGVNELLAKPLDPKALENILRNAKRLRELIAWMGDTDEDYPNAGGVIAKSAFNQLFLSAMDRADRYNEPASLLRIRLDNFDEVRREDGEQAASYLSSKLAHHLVRLRRQSDIIAQTGRSEYCLLLQRPQTPQEPIDAANRFATSLNDLADIASSGFTPAHISVDLITLPTGHVEVSHTITHAGESGQTHG